MTEFTPIEPESVHPEGLTQFAIEVTWPILAGALIAITRAGCCGAEDCTDTKPKCAARTALVTLQAVQKFHQREEKLPDWLRERVGDFTQLCSHGRQVMIERGKRYGDATSLTGVVGAAVALIGDIARLQQLILQNRDELNEEAIADAFTDIHNYACIGAAWLRGGNIDGRKYTGGRI